MTKFKVGDKVRLISDHFKYDVGDTFKIAEIDEAGDVYDSELTCVLKERLVLAPQTPTKNQRISTLESQVAELQEKVEAFEKAQKRDTALKTTVDKYSEALRKLAEDGTVVPRKKTSLTPNEQRKAIIAEAKAFVEEYEAVRAGESNKANEGTSTARIHYYEAEFAVKDSKVTAVIYRLSHGRKRQGKPSEIGRSKCAPDDVFNADIGKAIALGRALGLDVSRFEQAVKPSEVVVGMRVQSIEIGTGIVRFTHKASNTVDARYITKELAGDSVGYSYAKITDDTEAKY